jgi:branched-chain amino acid aminotransferase
MLDPQGFVCRLRRNPSSCARQSCTPDRPAARSTASRAIPSSRSRTSSAFVIERRITRDEIYIADEAFTGTAAEVTPIREYDNRTIETVVAVRYRWLRRSSSI